MGFEFAILNLIQGLRTPFLDTLMPMISSFGGSVWIVLALVLLVRPQTRKAGIIVTAALLVDVLLCNGIIKHLVERTRPCDINTQIQLIVGRPHGFSFPSAHTAASFAAVAALYFSGMKKLWRPALLISCLVAFSRMYLYVHYPTDILGGIVFGSFSGYLGYRLVAYALQWRKQTHGNSVPLIKESKLKA